MATTNKSSVFKDIRLDLIIIGLVILMVVIIFGSTFNNRLDRIEDDLNYSRPANYTAPDIKKYQVASLSQDSIKIKQKVYVPTYSHVYYEQGRPVSLETTLSIRNTDPHKSIYLGSVEYFDTMGKSVRKYVDSTIKLAPLQTIDFLVEARDSTGGSGANFMVEWLATDSVETPLIEAVMTGMVGTQGFCFARTGHTLGLIENK